MRTAGGGADEQARRAADTVSDLRRRLEAAERRQHAWQAGAEGERLVARELDRLTEEGWSVLHDVHWPGRPRANLDHVAIGPGGILVIDSKNWLGEVTLRDGVLRCGNWRKDGELDSVASAVAAVAALLDPARRVLVRGVLCLVQQDQPATRTSAGVVVVGRTGVVAAVRSLPPALTPADVNAVTSRLRALLGSVTSPALLTTATLPEPRKGLHEPPARTRREHHRQAPRRLPVTRPTTRPPRPSPHRRALVRVLKIVLVCWLVGFALVVTPHLAATGL